jgi:cell division protein FtsZ
VSAALTADRKFLTVAVVTVPFAFEASRRQQNAQNGLSKLRANADTLVAVPNDKLLGLLPKQTTFEMSLRVADEVLRQGVQGLTELISKPGLINMDFANVRALMQTAGPSMMAIGQGTGEHKATHAVRQALQMPLLDLKSACAAVLVPPAARPVALRSAECRRIGGRSGAECLWRHGRLHYHWRTQVIWS